MSSANENWTRWIFASVANHVKVLAATENLPMIVNGLDAPDATYMKAAHRAETRITGPSSQELSHNWFRLEVDVGILFSSRLGVDRYAVLKHIGAFQSSMDSNIPVYKYGGEVGDDDSLLGCLTPRTGLNNAVRVLHFGQPSPNEEFNQSLVDVRYVMEISE